MTMVADATREDLDPQAVAEYRRLREDVNPGAEELAYSDDDLLEGICALRRVDDVLRPTVAGIVLFGKALALRRLMPALRVDYVRVAGSRTYYVLATESGVRADSVNPHQLHLDILGDAHAGAPIPPC